MQLYRRLSIVILWLYISVAAVAVAACPTGECKEPSDLDVWLEKQYNISVTHLLANISPPGTRSGVVIAATSRHHPDYYYHWIRDSALAMAVVNGLYERSAVDSDESRAMEARMWAFVELTTYLQWPERPSPGLGEPKFYVNGDTFTGPWGRPQNDGPALRALTLIHFAETYVGRGGKMQTVLDRLYPADGHWGIKADLAYVAAPTLGQGLGFDIWEEVRGHHFYTRLAQQAAMVAGQRFCGWVGDADMGDRLEKTRRYLGEALPHHWSEMDGHILETLDWAGGVGDKPRSITFRPYSSPSPDSSPSPGTAAAPQSITFRPDSPEIRATLTRLLEMFERLYSINKRVWDPSGHVMGPALGRYAEDKYDGYGRSWGNPWFLTTAAVAEYMYVTVGQWLDEGRIVIDGGSEGERRFFERVVGGSLGGEDGRQQRQTVVWSRSSDVFRQLVCNATLIGDAFLYRVKYHAGAEGRLSEQMNRHTGFEQGARDLTWSYAAVVTAKWARDEVVNHVRWKTWKEEIVYRQDWEAEEGSVPAAA
ncbi:Six-hairpin glycosidase-like protein [Powellomyces hirtus]|nr:Six-hairpin glycosidase-like protein [Powellomyces hirtus]